MKRLVKILSVILVLFPSLAFAQLGSIGNLLGQVDQIVRFSIPLVGSIALLVFFWGLVKFIVAQGNEAAKADAKKIMVWGLIALFVMISVWGIIRFMQEALSITNNAALPMPTLFR